MSDNSWKTYFHEDLVEIAIEEQTMVVSIEDIPSPSTFIDDEIHPIQIVITEHILNSVISNDETLFVIVDEKNMNSSI